MVRKFTAILPQPYLQEGEIHISAGPKYNGTKLFLNDTYENERMKKSRLSSKLVMKHESYQKSSLYTSLYNAFDVLASGKRSLISDK